MERVPAQIAKQLVDGPGEEPVLRARSAASRPSIAAGRARAARDARRAPRSRTRVVPAYRRFARVLRRASTCPPACPTVGAWQLPRGDEAYAYLARMHTTTKHDRPRRSTTSASARSRASAARCSRSWRRRSASRASLPRLLRVAPHRSAVLLRRPARALRGVPATAKRIDPRLVTLFRDAAAHALRRRAHPRRIAPDTTTAYYREPAADGSRAGTYFVNLYKPEARPKWEMMALTLHESRARAPPADRPRAGAAGPARVPPPRRDGPRSSRAGASTPSRSATRWASTTTRTPSSASSPTRCGAPCGSSSTPASTPCTGTASARSTTSSRTPRRPSSTSSNEIDRYIAWPGQALAYKIGQLEILRLREAGARRRSARGSTSASFHDVVLRDGALPLDVLESQQSTRGSPAPRASREHRALALHEGLHRLVHGRPDPARRC